MRILIVEDDLKTREFLKKGLTENGFVVDAIGNGSEGLHLARNGVYDLIILDPEIHRTKINHEPLLVRDQLQGRQLFPGLVQEPHLRVGWRYGGPSNQDPEVHLLIFGDRARPQFCCNYCHVTAPLTISSVSGATGRELCADSFRSTTVTRAPWDQRRALSEGTV